MTAKLDLLRALIDHAIAEWLHQDVRPLADDIHEQALAARLAHHVDRASRDAGLDGYVADVEYNRNRGAIKTYLDDRLEVIVMKCDLILHARGASDRHDNLVAIELKKGYSDAASLHENRTRLRAITKQADVWPADLGPMPPHVFGYRLGCLIVIDRKRLCIDVEEFVNGEKVAMHTRAI